MGKGQSPAEKAVNRDKGRIPNYTGGGDVPYKEFLKGGDFERGSFRDLMLRDPLISKQYSELYKHSEFKKPYRNPDDDFPEMEFYEEEFFEEQEDEGFFENEPELNLCNDTCSVKTAQLGVYGAGSPSLDIVGGESIVGDRNYYEENSDDELLPCKVYVWIPDLSPKWELEVLSVGDESSFPPKPIKTEGRDSLGRACTVWLLVVTGEFSRTVTVKISKSMFDDCVAMGVNIGDFTKKATKCEKTMSGGCGQPSCNMAWSSGNPDTISRGVLGSPQSVGLSVDPGNSEGPYSWELLADTGDGFSLNCTSDCGTSNTLYADESACGTAFIRVTSADNCSVLGSVRCPDAGAWALVINCESAPYNHDCYPTINAYLAAHPITIPTYNSGAVYHTSYDPTTFYQVTKGGIKIQENVSTPYCCSYFWSVPSYWKCFGFWYSCSTQQNCPSGGFYPGCSNFLSGDPAWTGNFYGSNPCHKLLLGNGYRSGTNCCSQEPTSADKQECIDQSYDGLKHYVVHRSGFLAWRWIC